MTERILTPSGGHGPTDLEIVQQVRRWLDSKEAEIENRYLKRVCWLAEQQIKGRTVKALSAPSEKSAPLISDEVLQERCNELLTSLQAIRDSTSESHNWCREVASHTLDGDAIIWGDPKPSPSSATRRTDEPVWVWGLTQEGIRDEVAQFAASMERKLKANDHKDHWEGAPMGYLLRRLREEVAELEQAVRSSNDPVKIGGEAADVGNFAMMIADNMASLSQLPGKASALSDGGTDNNSKENTCNRT